MEYKAINFSEFNNTLSDGKSNNEQLYRKLYKRIRVQLSNQNHLMIRWMHYNDIQEVCKLESELFPTPWPVESFLYELENRNYNVSLVGLIENKVVSYAVSYLVSDEIHIGNLAVDQSFHRLKIGETMLKLLLQIGMAKNCYFAHLEVRKSNIAAISLYKKFGFEIEGVRKNYYQTEKEDALLMTRKLEGKNINVVV